MEYRRLGNSGLQVSALSFGSWVTFGSQIDYQNSENLMKLAYENGVNFFDNAEVYASGKSEEVMGKILNKMGWNRSSYVVSSKVFWGGDGPNLKGLMRKHVVEACHAALKRLQVDYLDLFFCHRPDANTPIAETVWTMHNLIQQGKILYWGTSEWTAQQITEAHLVAEKYNLIGPTMEQPQYNLLHREKMENEFLPLFKNFGLGTTIWSPLASGVLTGKYLNGIPKGSRMEIESLSWIKERVWTEENKNKVQQLKNLADNLGVSLTNLSIAWCLKNENVSTVILGAT
ncbi:MAG: aldo/keto reductase, partial [Bacteroidetes bacterium]|nr:aldo/keto reductase [Bacteroidota bacterium]